MSGADNYELPDRHTTQAEGTHPAPCARHCEANAYEFELRRLKAEVARLREAAKVDMEPVAWICGERPGPVAFTTYKPDEDETGWTPVYSANLSALEAHDTQVRIKCLEDAAEQLIIFGEKYSDDEVTMNFLDCEAELRRLADELKEQS